MGKMASTSLFLLEFAPGVPKQKKIYNLKLWYGRTLQKLNLSTCPNNSDITIVTKVRQPHLV